MLQKSDLSYLSPFWSYQTLNQELFTIDNDINRELYYSSLRDSGASNRMHRITQLILSLFQSRGHVYTQSPIFVPVQKDRHSENEVAMIDTSGLKVEKGFKFWISGLWLVWKNLK